MNARIRETGRNFRGSDVTETDTSGVDWEQVSYLLHLQVRDNANQRSVWQTLAKAASGTKNPNMMIALRG